MFLWVSYFTLCFEFEPVFFFLFSLFQDILLTLKDKLSIRVIEYFALVLEQQYSITKLLLLHEDELIQKVVAAQANVNTTTWLLL